MSRREELEYTEKDAALGKPVALFRIENTVYKVAILPMDAADDWLDKFPAAIMTALNEHQANRHDREKRRAYVNLVRDAVLGYGEMLPADLAQDKVTMAQYVEAYSELCKVTDPLEFSNFSATAKVRRQMEGVPNVPDELIEKALEQAASQNGSQT